MSGGAVTPEPEPDTGTLHKETGCRPRGRPNYSQSIVTQRACVQVQGQSAQADKAGPEQARTQAEPKISSGDCATAADTRLGSSCPALPSKHSLPAVYQPRARA